MATTIDLRVRLMPWDDPAFVHAFETAREQVRLEGLTVNGPHTCARLQEILREAGYLSVTVDCERTAGEAMAHSARWTVRRDGSPN
jgi:hypothetical protein